MMMMMLLRTRIIVLWLALLQTPCRGIVNLPFGDVNVLILTDVHSWVGGHGAHESIDADYGDILSFYERLKEDDRNENYDLWFVMNGDFMDGTGLSTYPPHALVPILERMPWDAVNIGNHELYMNETVAYISQPGGMIESFGKRYLTSNVLNASSDHPLGHRYRLLRGRHATILTFGFIYNLDILSPLARVERVEHVVKQDWFLHVLRNEDFDAILVLAHMDVQDPLVSVILSAIRNETGPTMPVQFITGHTHYRGYHVLDDYSTSFEAGRYLDTLGFVSFPTKATAEAAASATPMEDSTATTAGALFQHTFLDAAVEVLTTTLGVSTLKTDDGQALSDFIHSTQEQMGLKKVVGCSPQSYYTNRSLFDLDSLWKLWVNEILPTQFLTSSKVILQGKGSAFRYDLFEGTMTVDDILAVSPFNDTMYLIAASVRGDTILQLNETMNELPDLSYLPEVPNYILIGDVSPDGAYDLFTLEYEVPFVKEALEAIYDDEVIPKPVEATSTGIWFAFIEENWEDCSSSSMKDDGSQGYSERPSSARETERTLLVVIGMVVCLGTCGAYLFGRATRPYVLTQPDDLLFDTNEATMI